MGPLKLFVGEQKLFPGILQYISHHIRYLRICYEDLRGDLYTLLLPDIFSFFVSFLLAFLVSSFPFLSLCVVFLGDMGY